jgi:hypothetical protein
MTPQYFLRVKPWQNIMFRQHDPTRPPPPKKDCMATFNCFKQNSVSISLDKADGSFGDELEWWKRNQLKYPYLARLACFYLAVPATSAPSERISSRASRILTLKRANLKPKVAQRIMFVKENLGILHKYYVSLAKGNKTEDQK